MKTKIIIITILALLIFIPKIAFSQARFGLYGGANFSRLTTNDDRFDVKPRISPVGGMLLNFYLKVDSRLEIGIQYSPQGVDYEYFRFVYETKELYEVKNQIDYIMIPVIWKEYFGDLYTKIGLYGEYKINASSYWKKTITYQDSITTSDGPYLSFTANLRAYDAGGIIGFGYQKPITDAYDFFIGTSLQIGFFNLDVATDRPRQLIRNQFFTVTTGIILVGKTNRYARFRRR